MVSFMYAVNSGSNWPCSGIDMARSTRGSTLTGPGPISSRGLGFNSSKVWLAGGMLGMLVRGAIADYRVDGRSR